MADYRPQMLAALQGRAEGYQLYRDYYAGRHRMAYSTDKFRNAFGNVLRRFADNLCPTVVDALADRLEVIGFCVEEFGDQELTAPVGGAPLPTDAAALRDELVGLARRVWQRNLMDTRAGAVHQETLAEGDGYVIVWPDQEDGFPRIHPQVTETIAVGYDREQPGKLLWGAKVWRGEGGLIRLTAYYPDRIEKWTTIKRADAPPPKLTEWEPYRVPSEEWPLANPYDQVPVFHFPNNAGVGSWGVSELQSVIPLQDALNKTVMDLLVAMEFVALPQRYVTGLEVETDDLTGKLKVPFRVGVDRVWQVASPDVRFGEFAGADLTHFIAVAQSLREEVARVTGTPLHYFSMMKDPPSGVALRALESRFIKRARDRQASYGDVWEDVMAFALTILGRPGARLKSEWGPVELQDEKAHAETLLLKQQVGVSRRQLLREAGYTDAVIDQMDEERSEEGQSTGAALLKSFSAGEVGGPGGGPANYP